MASWTDERIEQLKALWAEGKTASQIGERMGIGRGAVLAKAMRLDLSRKMKGSAEEKFDRVVELVSESDGELSVRSAAVQVGLPVKEAMERWEALVEQFAGDPGHHPGDHVTPKIAA